MGTAAKLSCSADWANKLDQAKRRKEADNMATNQLTQAMHQMTIALDFGSAAPTNLSPRRLPPSQRIGKVCLLASPLSLLPSFALLQKINK
jgi:hypothetical protein